MSPLYMVCGCIVRKQIITESSSNYGKKTTTFFHITERVKSTALHTEKAILLCRAGEHFHALQVLVHQEKDLQAAEAFCRRAAQGQNSQFRQALLLTLLQIYLRSENLTSAAIALINNNPQVFAAEKVIRLLPDSWSVQLVSQFLVGSLRETSHRRRMARLQMALSQAELMRHKVSWVSSTFYIFYDSEHCVYSCFICSDPCYPCTLFFTDAGFKNKVQTGQEA